MRKFLIFFIIFCLSCTTVEGKTVETIEAQSYVLLDGESGNVLLEKNSEEKLPPASITKIMTMLLTVEAIDSKKISLEDVATVSETAAQHEGSHVFLDVGEQITIHELLKAVAVASGNDAANVLAEYVGGDLTGFVEMMNQKARDLHMENTFFVNCNGLDAEGHYSTASDIAKMTYELTKHPLIFDYTTIWMDSLRNGSFQLSNTNKLVRFYDGATGMKTGFTSKAGYCLSATAERNGVKIIAVVMNSPTSTSRFGDASTLLNYGFDNYVCENLCQKGEILGEMLIKNGRKEKIAVVSVSNMKVIVPKGEKNKIEREISIPNNLEAPLAENTIVGKITYKLNGRVVGECNVVPLEKVPEITFDFTFSKLISSFLSIS